MLVLPDSTDGRAILSDMLVDTDDLFSLLFAGLDQLSGKPLSLWVSDYLDRLEFVAAQALLNDRNQQELGEERIARYASRLRTPGQRRRDRSNALLLSWAVHNSEAWTPLTFSASLIDPDSIGDLLEQSDPKMTDRTYSFGGYGFYDNQMRAGTLSFERVRQLRYLDQASKISLELARDNTWPQPFDYASASFSEATLSEARKVAAWRKAGMPAGGYFTGIDFTTVDLTVPTITGLWNAQVEQTIEEARKLAIN